MKICELKIPNWQDRNDLVTILAVAGYRVSIDKRRAEYAHDTDYFVIVESKEADND